MSPEQKNNLWKPSASIQTLRARADIIKIIRDFFAARNMLEVETPLLCHTSVTDPYIQSIKTSSRYLQTSPEYAMKRLLASGSGSIYQICKAFRDGDIGHLHNPEFTMLEWYRLQMDHHQLMDEMDELLQLILKKSAATRISYEALFESYLAIDPHTATVDELHDLAIQHNISVHATISDCTTWLQILMSNCIEPHIGANEPVFIYDFPISQAALARIQPGNPPVASRFEVYYKGIELANGFHELQDATQQRERFIQNNIVRIQSGLPELPIDEHFLAALQHGLPDCAGVALGIDRLVMLALDHQHIQTVLSFDDARA